MRMSVVLPAPFGPISPKTSPAGICSVRFSMATLEPYSFRKCRTSIIGVIERSSPLLYAGLRRTFPRTKSRREGRTMRDPRLKKLADLLLRHSCRLQPGDNVLIVAFDV